MAKLTPEAVVDIVNNTTKKFNKRKWVDLSLEHQEYVWSDVVTSHKVVEQGGTEIQFQLQTKNTGNAVTSGLYAQDQTSVEDVTITASVPWTKQSTSWAFDVDEALFQSDETTLLNLLLIREHDALNSLAELNEEFLWSSPSDSTKKQPMGIPFWIKKDASTTPDGAFNGGNPTGWDAGCAGVSSTTYPRWRNWTFGWTQASRDDLVKKLKKAIAFTSFRPPVPYQQLEFKKGADYQIYTTYRVTEPLEALAESRNDNLGQDLARYVGQVTIGGVPIKFVPYLEANDTSDPLYGVNWKAFRPYVLSGCDMRRSKPTEVAGQHTVRKVFIDTWMNYICVNRRCCFVGSKA